MKTLAPNCTLLATNSFNNDARHCLVNGLFLFHNIYVKEKMKKTKKTYPQQFANTSHKKNQILNFVKCNVSLPTYRFIHITYLSHMNILMSDYAFAGFFFSYDIVISAPSVLNASICLARLCDVHDTRA